MDRPKHAERIVAAARAMIADPSNMTVRAQYVRATFNHDWTAQVIVDLSDGLLGVKTGADDSPGMPFNPNPPEQGTDHAPR